MNNIKLTGIIKNIQFSHFIKDIEYNKANLIVKRDNGREDIINLKFKKFSNPYSENEEISLIGNLRTYSQKVGDKSKVELYVFTYLDIPEETENNKVELDGRICIINDLRKTKSGKDIIDFIIANNLIIDDQCLNAYIPCIAWGKQAKEINKLKIGDKIKVIGQLQSREYKKRISENDFEIRVCHELNINSFEQIND